MRLVGLKTCAPLLLRLLDDPEFRAGRTHTGYLERYVAESDWQALPALSDLPADVPALIAAVLYTHARQGAAQAVVGDAARARGSAWLDSGRREALR